MIPGKTTVACRECGAEIPALASECPECGVDRSTLEVEV